MASPPPTRPETAAGAVGKARDLLAAVRTLKAVERAGRAATAAERDDLARFPGFGPVALTIFPNPATGRYSDAGWQARGEELAALLTPDEYASAKRTTFSQYFTAPAVMAALHAGLARLGVPAGATVLEPGCGTGNFLTAAHRYIGVELDSVTGRIAKLLHPAADIRVENFRDTKLPPLDGVIGNVPFADLKLDWRGERLALHDFFLAKAVDALKPGGVLACVTSRFTLDKQNAAARERLAAQADFLGAVRLPSDAFRREGTEVVTDLVFLRKRGPGEPRSHADPAWLETAPLEVEGATVPVTRYFLAHPEMVLGAWSRKDTLYGGEGVSVIGTGDLAEQLAEAVGRLPRFEPLQVDAQQPQPPPAPAFVPPPPLRHVVEGSLFTGDDRAIYQIEDGRPAPVTYCGVRLRADGTPQGRKIGQLIELRDRARRVLQSQNEGWPAPHRDAERQALNRAYDRFVSQHGPVNKTTLTDTKFGTIRRMPNLVRFRDDPDAMLVMSLEEYDEATGTAAKAAILRQDVVGPKPPVTRVTSAEDGLLVSLDRTGGIDLPLIARLYGRPEPAVIAELGDLIYRDPATARWETADAYLAGNVRDKLAAARAAGPEYARNAVALEQVQPEDVLPGDIDANLGAPWIPASDIRAFAADLFAVPPEAIKVDHLKPDAVWCLEADHRAQNSVSATADYGTGRVNGTTLLELALNLKSPAIYDVIRSAEGEQRVLNPSETLAAKEKQRRIKDQFKAWVFSDPDRTERLVRTYNDAFNSLRPRLFDGSHLDFPGMSQAFELRPHQRDAVWRCMSGGNTLLAHVVGAGKTAVMVTAAMKMRQAGLCHKPLVVVPNHMLEQITREWLHLYPNARILTATKDDFTKDKRKHLTAKIATGDWDGVVVTQSGFERMGMSREYQERFLREQIAEYEALLAGNAGGGRNLLKTIEKQKMRREERLKSLLAEDKKDDGLVFDELGVDQLFVDESHYAKNLETPTKMERVAGVQTGGSERAFDLYMKCRYLDEKHPGRGVVFASGTPVSNSMVELYTVQKFLDPAGLQSRGIAHFDGWAATFGEVVEAMEISPDGATLKPRSRFAKFVNLPELVQLFRSFADVQTADMLDLPRPKLEGGKAQTVACPMSDVQREMQTKLVERYERIRSERVDPREDNALAITTDGRKLALDGRLYGAVADFPGSKVNALVRNVHRIWQDTADTLGTQLVFCDLGVHARPHSVYDDVVAKLTAAGIPASQVAVMGDADTDAKKQALFERVRQGTVRVLIGSTAKMGTGTNVQTRLVALHHLDAPWKPAEVEQREGRILRQGNTNAEVSIFRYVTEGSFDAYMWQALETKARFIAQVMTGDCAVRTAEDVGGQELSYAEVKAIASGNPAVLTLAEADAELQRLAILRKNHHDEQYLARRSLRELPDRIAGFARRIELLGEDVATLAADDLIVIGKIALPHAAVIDAIGQRMERLPRQVGETRTVPLGVYHGLAFGLFLHPLGGLEVYLDGRVQRRTELRDQAGPRAVLNAVDRLAGGYAVERERAEQDFTVCQGQMTDFEARLGAVFPHEAYAGLLTDLRDRLRAGLAEKAPESASDGPSVAELAERIASLRGRHAVEAAPTRVGGRIGTPVTPRRRVTNLPRPLDPEELPPPDTLVPTIAPPPADPIPAAAYRDRAGRPQGRQPGLF